MEDRGEPEAEKSVRVIKEDNHSDSGANGKHPASHMLSPSTYICTDSDLRVHHPQLCEATILLDVP